MTKKVLGWISFGFMMLTILVFITVAFIKEYSTGITMLFILALFSLPLVGGVVGNIVGTKVKILTGILFILAGLDILFLGFLCLSGGVILGMAGLLFGFVSMLFYIISAILFFIAKGK